ncbi:maleylpyruvate isomerase N-terminal domain-containing protein [Streptomyces sp. NPDC002564]|uniref:maleylpyruvate isomerase N-terminal domain-containing protein n=1 Tax=Streptomyces sp. NPDC002564 TaxID=3364649 RepID=UPI0036D1DC5D
MSGSTETDEHSRLRKLLGAWALHSCSPQEAERIDEHLRECEQCAAEALRLRAAAELLHARTEPELPPTLRAQVLGACLGARAPDVAVPDYAQPYDSETARLDGLLADLAEDEWSAPVTLAWFEDQESVTRDTSVRGVLGHLMAVDGMVSTTLGLPDPVTRTGKQVTGPRQRTEALWQQMLSPDGAAEAPEEEDGPESVRDAWREQAYELIRLCAFGGGGVADIAVPYGDGVVLPLRLALLDRAFETWIHATDIAEAVDYPYPPPVPEHLRSLISVAVEMLPSILAARRQAGLASPPLPVLEPGAAERSLRLEIEGESGGAWYLPLDTPGGRAGPDNCVSHLVLPEVDFCRLAAGRLSPLQVAAGQQGDRTAIVELLHAVSSMSRL